MSLINRKDQENVDGNCPGFKCLADLHYGELPFSEIESVERHLEDCSSCKDILSELSLMSDTFLAIRGNMRAQDISVQNPRIAASSVKSGAFGWILRPSAGLAFAVVALFMVVTVVILSGSLNQTEEANNESAIASVLLANTAGTDIANKSTVSEDATFPVDGKPDMVAMNNDAPRLSDIEFEIDDGIRLGDLLAEVD